MTQLILFPCNGNAREALDCVSSTDEFLGFVDDNVSLHGGHMAGYKIYGRDFLGIHQEAKVVAVPGSPTSFRQRVAIIDSLGLAKQRFSCLIHPNATIGKNVNLGMNVVIMSGAVVTSNASIGNNVIILPNSVIHHDSVIGDYSVIGSNVTIAGNVQVGRCCYIASGSSLINGITIGEESIVGMGSTIIRSVPASSKVAGNPGRVLGEGKP